MLIFDFLTLYFLLKLERVMGIEPTPSAWKAEVLPLNYTRVLSKHQLLIPIALSIDFTSIELQFAEQAISKLNWQSV
jgi:hypothetical protein